MLYNYRSHKRAPSIIKIEEVLPNPLDDIPDAEMDEPGAGNVLNDIRNFNINEPGPSNAIDNIENVASPPMSEINFEDDSDDDFEPLDLDLSKIQPKPSDGIYCSPVSFFEKENFSQDSISKKIAHHILEARYVKHLTQPAIEDMVNLGLLLIDQFDYLISRETFSLIDFRTFLKESVDKMKTTMEKCNTDYFQKKQLKSNYNCAKALPIYRKDIFEQRLKEKEEAEELKFQKAQSEGKFYKKITNFDVEDILKPNDIIGHRLQITHYAKQLLENVELVDSILKEDPNVPNPSTGLTGVLERRQSFAKCLRLVISADDVNISSNNPEKLIAMYAEFQNLPIEIRMKKRNVFLVAFIKRKHLQKGKTDDEKFQLQAVLSFLREELKNLHFGIEVGNRMIPVRLVAVVGDNLAINELLGFSRGFNYAQFVCRICMSKDVYSNHNRMIMDGMDSETDLDDTQDRFMPIFNEKKLLTIIGSDKETYGKYVKASFCFQGIGDVTIANIAPLDAMHDVGEGVAQYVLLSLISLLVGAKYYSTSQVKELVAAFPFVSGSIEIKESTSKSWLDVTVSNFAVKSLIDMNLPIPYKKSQNRPEEDKEIDEIAETEAGNQQRKNKRTRTKKEAQLITTFTFLGTTCHQKLEFLARFRQVFPKFEELKDKNIDQLLKFLYDFSKLVFAMDLPDDEIKKVDDLGNLLSLMLIPVLSIPKVHFLRHYGAMIKQFGPSGLLTSFKFERAHQPHKRRAQAIRSRRNLTKSLAQMWAYEYEVQSATPQLLKCRQPNQTVMLYDFEQAPAIDWPHKRARNDPDHGLLRKVICNVLNYPQKTLFISPEKYYRSKQNGEMCYGEIFELSDMTGTLLKIKYAAIPETALHFKPDFRYRSYLVESII